MLSVLIPIYNCRVVKLVKDLSEQANANGINFEIICMDDGSNKSIKSSNREVNGMFGVNYVELSQNVGRSRIRNKLASIARFQHLLFLDGDSRIASRKFLAKYVERIQTAPETVWIGGREYQKKPPADQRKYLHWLYGTRRESKPATKRNRRPFDYIHTNNLLVPSKVLLSIPFDHQILLYGYEDLEWGQRIARSGIKVIHIDNKILHGNLSLSDEFCDKVQQSIMNLSALYKSGKIDSTRLIRYYERFRSFGLTRATYFLLRHYLPWIKKSLLGNRPKLYQLDLFKMYSFINFLEKG